jgi:hypothetical protein
VSANAKICCEIGIVYFGVSVLSILMLLYNCQTARFVQSLTTFIHIKLIVFYSIPAKATESPASSAFFQGSNHI